MPKRRLITPKGRSFLSGKRTTNKSFTPRGFPKPKPAIQGPVYVNGVKMNAAEATVWFRVLVLRNEDWLPQQRIETAAGVGQADFESRSRRQVIEVDGPFHHGLIGEARDFVRNAVRKQAGLEVIRIPWPLPQNLVSYVNDRLAGLNK